MCAGIVLAMVQVTACGDDETCTTNSDCKPGQICRIGLCALDPNQVDGTSILDAQPDVPLTCRLATPADLVMNEIMADPPTGADIDGDGTASSTKDEFVEVVSLASEDVALSNVEIDVNGKRAPLGNLCLKPNQARVLFGSGGLPGLTNTGATVSLVISGTSAQSHTYGSDGNSDQSITLKPQLDKDGEWVKSKVTWGPAYTPGTCSDLSAFPNCGTSPVVEGDVETVDSETVVPQCSQVPIATDLVINEILADPGSGLTGNDANGDGIVDANDDEFVEIVNTSTATLLLTGVKVRDASNATFTFPAGTCVAPNQAIVVFGKYTGTGDFAGVLTFDHLGFAVNNTNETITLFGADEAILSSVATGSLGDKDQSIVRATDLDPTALFVNHTAAANSGGRRMSPGRCQSGADFPDCGAPPVEVVETTETVDDSTTSPTDISEVIDDVASDVSEEVGPSCGPLATAADLVINEALLDPGPTYDANGDGTPNTLQDEFVELVSIASAPVRLDGLQIWDSVSLKYTIPAGTCLGPNEALVVFGKGAKLFTAAGVVVVDTTTHALDLNNGSGATADTVTLKASATETLLTQPFAAADDQSWTRSPDLTGTFTKHLTANAALPASPGQCLSGVAFPMCVTPPSP